MINLNNKELEDLLWLLPVILYTQCHYLISAIVINFIKSELLGTIDTIDILARQWYL